MANTHRTAAIDDRPPPRVPEPLFPVLRRLAGDDVQRARSWLLAWLLDRLGQRIQEPPGPSYHVQRRAGEEWVTVMGPFYRSWLAVQIAREFAHMNRRWRYRVVGPDTEVEVANDLPGSPGADHGE